MLYQETKITLITEIFKNLLSRMYYEWNRGYK